MRRMNRWACAGLMVLGGLAATATARAEDRPADKILADLKEARIPALEANIRSNPKAIGEWFAKRQEVARTRSALIRELYNAHPDNAELPALLVERWQTEMMSAPSLGGKSTLSSEIDDVLAKTKNEKLRVDALFWKANVAFRTNSGSVALALPTVEEFIHLAPSDERGAQLLFMMSSAPGVSTERRKEFLNRLVASYPESRFKPMAEGAIKQLDGVGKPFDLEFTDAIKGSPVSIKGLRGKVVVIDFWATWCGPCVAEMPNMKKLYAEYRDKGVEFIGVSLDQPEAQGGLTKLKEFVAKNEITWPQYYQGNGWQSTFSTSWGINSIPSVFLVDAEGKLASVNARGQLETLIPEYLKKAGAEAGGN